MTSILRSDKDNVQGARDGREGRIAARFADRDKQRCTQRWTGLMKAPEFEQAGTNRGFTFCCAPSGLQLSCVRMLPLVFW
ncbi:MAG: hypothetical protein R6U98_03420, partial [Pirellulaceae bacterium]